MAQNKRRHLLGIEGLKIEEIRDLMSNSLELEKVLSRDIKKVPSLRGRSVINLFYESSTRTRVSFELAAKRLSADAINVSSSGSSTSKGETLLDTARTIGAMSPDILVVRHPASGAANFLSQHLSNVSIVNAGDGQHEHPTQALLDLLSLTSHLGCEPRGLRIAICGDVKHSRVARSTICLHKILGNKITLVGPPSFVPKELCDEEAYGSDVEISNSLRQGIAQADVILCLRVQNERDSGHSMPDLYEYSKYFCVSKKIVEEVAQKAIILHAGPMNRGVEISSDIADSSVSLVQNQVAAGVALRMAVLLSMVSLPVSS
jgi:aspartate carbamoyltransferase catalytic subunit